MKFNDRKQAYKFLMENWSREHFTEPIKLKIVIEKNKAINNYGLKYVIVSDINARISGPLHALILFLCNHYLKTNNIQEILKHVESKNENINIVNNMVKDIDTINKNESKEKKQMAKKTLTNLEKVLNCLKKGSKTKLFVISRKVYGDISEYSLKKARTAISDLRRKGYDIDLISEGTYQLKKSSCCKCK